METTHGVEPKIDNGIRDVTIFMLRFSVEVLLQDLTRDEKFVLLTFSS